MFFAMAAEITHHLAAAGRMSDVNCILQIELVRHGLQIVGIVIHIMAAIGLSRAAMSTPVNSDDPITLGEKEQHLRVPIVRAEWPTMTEHDRLSTAPILVIYVDVGSILFSNNYVWHDVFPFDYDWLLGTRST